MVKFTIAGVDIGSVSIAIVLLDSNGEVLYRDYCFHNGNMFAVLEEMIQKLPAGHINNLGVVDEGRKFFKEGVEVNEQIALIEGVKHKVQHVGSIITIGGETFGLILFDNSGQYKKYIANSLCAAGTGSFLDQQASRLGLSSSEALSRIAQTYRDEPPKIATRCAVFAKTDLAHMQQQGYSLEAITAGLCQGVAQNIHDTLFHGVDLIEPVIVVGGVSKNRKVIQYLEKILKCPVLILQEGEYAGALGAALIAKKHYKGSNAGIPKSELLKKTTASKSYHYPPLSEIKSPVTEFSSWRSFLYGDVEVDIYMPIEGNVEIDCYVGIDIGSTSTKASLMTPQGEVLAGLYTRTFGQPIAAVQKITRVIEHLEKNFSVQFMALGAGTTGSGRKFIQKVARADYAVDEITAHARAAYHLNPEIDTIIEIGGQDAKFTVMKNGNVIFSVMNFVCAAGTGSFIEEQARRLGIDLFDYSRLAIDAPSPLISNRCTVFMERDLNHMLSLGYSRKELLAAALHAVRENYLSKVAHVGKIGNYIAFQGATAKNYALVKAFEQKLKKQIYVSKFCHLTGALGVCLKLKDSEFVQGSHFRKTLHNDEIAVDEYVCEYCKNHCKIKTIEIDGDVLGWGYLCGRDEKDTRYRKRQTEGFSMLHSHRKVFTIDSEIISAHEKAAGSLFKEFKEGGILSVVHKSSFSLTRLKNHIQFNLLALRDDVFAFGVMLRHSETDTTPLMKIGLPSVLPMMEFLPLWKLFFRRLGLFPVIAENISHIKQGKELSGAEFCAPLMEFHGQIKALSTKADFIFFPQVFENISHQKQRKAYCYYTHYAVPLVKNIPELKLEGKLIAPVLDMYENRDEIIRKLYMSMPDKIKRQITFNRIEDAFSIAWDWFQERRKDLEDFFRDQLYATDDIKVVFMGRPYLVLNNVLNKHVPDIVAEKGIQAFYMDMVPIDEGSLEAAKDFITWNHWHYGNIIIKAAEIVAQTEGLFPIYLTAFKCSADSFIISYFRNIMDYYQKPYLILQLDEHETGEGYETRIEAAIETFRSFHGAPKQKHRPEINLKRSFEDKTYLLPAYDWLSARLMQAVFERAGIKTLLIDQTPDTIYRGLELNDGQCLPVSALTQGILHTIKNHNLNPEQVALFSNSECEISCNLPQYPIMIKQTLEKMGNGLEKVDILVSRFLPTGFSLEMMYEIYLAYVMTGLLQKITHRIRPREKIAGNTDRCYQKAADALYACFLKGGSKEEIFQKIVNDFSKIDIKGSRLPQVGIVGDLYVRDNETFNQNLLREIECSGAEGVTVPFIESINIIAELYFKNKWEKGKYLDLLKDKVAYNTLKIFQKKMAAIAKPLLEKAFLSLKKDPLYYLQQYSLTARHEGEAAENLLKIFYLYEHYPDLTFIVNVNPIFCCPGLISEAIYQKVERDIGIPIVSITYDGTQTHKNKILKPYLYFLKMQGTNLAH